jgi:hypothetical protein
MWRAAATARGAVSQALSSDGRAGIRSSTPLQAVRLPASRTLPPALRRSDLYHHVTERSGSRAIVNGVLDWMKLQTGLWTM